MLQPISRIPYAAEVAVIKHRTREEGNHPTLVRKMLTAVTQRKPDILITPRYSIKDKEEFIRIYGMVKDASPGTALITGNGREWIGIPYPDHVLDDHIYDTILSRNVTAQKPNSLDFLIALNESGEIKDRHIQSLKKGGYFIRCNRYSNGFVVRKNEKNLLEPVFPIINCEKDSVYDTYMLGLCDLSVKKV